MSGLAPELPLKVTEEDGAYGLIKDYATLVKQNMKMLVLTNPGERVMIPDFGVGLYELLFENYSSNENIVQSKFNARLGRQVSVYLPFVEIEDVQFSNLQDNSLNIKIYYTIIPLNFEDSVDFSILNREEFSGDVIIGS